jgi:hypothetical protein
MGARCDIMDATEKQSTRQCETKSFLISGFHNRINGASLSSFFSEEGPRCHKTLGRLGGWTRD